MRQHLIVAQTINNLCQRLPGTPKVSATADGWTTTSPTGRSRFCPTIDDLWRTVLASAPATTTVLATLPAEETDPTDPEEHLRQAVLNAAHTVATGRAILQGRGAG